MSADKHRSRDRRRALIYAASHDWLGTPIRRPVTARDPGCYPAVKRTLRNRDVRRLLREGHLRVHRYEYRGGPIFSHPTVRGRLYQRTLSRSYLVVT